ncbi:unnamed protein product [Lactuca saligna]|uniref:DUF1985 domain-containing protein n=1 Tax=Lactuca saligna TaxID=75948 RepID=A0AA35Z589_LACSI|nr:unnamed protein product [Lactuca saligna]
MPTPNGDPMLYHLMMLHEVRDVEVVRARRFWFELQGRVVEYGEIEFCLISGLRFGPYVDIINTKVSKSLALRNRLFPNVRDEDLRLNDLENYVKGSAFSMCSDEDAVMVMQMIFLLRGLIGRYDNTCFPSAMYELADSQYNWNRFLRDGTIEEQKREKPQKENNVAKRPLLLDNYADCDDEFWKLRGKKMGAVFVEHRLLRDIDMNCQFWSSLLGIGFGWLLFEEISPSNGRWTIINPECTTLEPRKQHYLRRITVGMVDGPHWKDIDQLNGVVSLKKHASGGSFKSLEDSILSELDHISYWAHFPNRQKPTEVKFVKAKHVPQQEKVEKGERGDCEVFVCMFMEMLASGVPVETRESPRGMGFTYHNRMAEIIWNSRF